MGIIKLRILYRELRVEQRRRKRNDIRRAAMRPRRRNAHSRAKARYPLRKQTDVLIRGERRMVFPMAMRGKPALRPRGIASTRSLL